LLLVRLLPYSAQRLGDRRGGFPTFKPTGLAPQNVAETDEGDATRDTYQRKVFYDGTYFFVVFWTGAPTRQVKYTASADGITWATPTVLWTFSVAPYYGGNIDIQYPNKGALDYPGNPYVFSIVFSGSNGANWYFYAMTITNQTLNKQSSTALAGTQMQGGTIIAGLLGTEEYWVIHALTEIRIGRWATIRETSTEVSHGGTTTGGAQILTYETSGTYNLLVLAKGGDNKLYYNLADYGCYNFLGSFTEIATLGTGFSDFCGCSEAQNVGHPERVHLVYIKTSGELCYGKFENDAWSTEKVLVTSGASYPVIAVGANGKLYVFYVKDGNIWIIHYNGKRWLRPTMLFTDEHTYNNPAYLSSNQNVQSEKICLVWTEGTASPYEVWFAYLID